MSVAASRRHADVAPGELGQHVLGGLELLARHARELDDRVADRQTAPGRREIERAALPGQGRSAVHLARQLDEHLLGERHQGVEIDIRPVELEHGELGVVLGGDPLVAEVAVDLVHPVHAADREPFQEQLRSDAHVELEIERVVMRRERPRVGAGRDQMHHRRLDLDEAPSVEERADAAHDPGTHLEDAPRLGVRDEVEIALPIAGLDVGEAVPLLGQRSERLGEQRELVGEHGELAGARAQQRAGDAELVAEIEQFEDRTRRLRQLVAPHHDLQLGAAVVQVEEPGLALLAQGAHAAGNAQANRRLLELLGGALVVARVHVGRLEIVLEAVRIGVHAERAQALALVSAILDLFVELRHRTATIAQRSQERRSVGAHRAPERRPRRRSSGRAAWPSDGPESR